MLKQICNFDPYAITMEGSKGSALETLGWEFSVEKGGKRMGKSWGLWDNPHENLEVLMDI